MMPQKYWDLINELYRSGNPELIKMADKAIEDNRKITQKHLRRMDNILYGFVFACAIIVLYVLLQF